MDTKKLGSPLTLEMPNVIVQRVGTPGADTYVFEQAYASDLWVIEHGLNKFPSCTVVDSAGTAVIGEVEYINKQTIHVHFTAKFSGKAYLN